MKIIISLIVFCNTIFFAKAQQITGYWHGNVGGGFGTKHELKIVLKGDSLVGTSYYYSSKTKYQKYSVKGYFDARTNAVIWWDDQLLESKTGKIGILPQREIEMLAEADFNCPGSGKMKLEGKAKNKNKANQELKIDLSKVQSPVFEDAWNEVIDNWLTGGNNPEFIKDVLAYELGTKPTEKTVALDNDKVIVYTETKTPNETITETTFPVKESPKNTEKTIAEKPIENTTPNPNIKATQPNPPTSVEQEKKPPIEFLDVTKKKTNNTIEQPVIDTVMQKENEIAKKTAISIPPKDVTIAETTPTKKEPIEFLNTKKAAPVVQQKIDTIAKPIIVKTDETILKEKLEERKKVILAELPIADSIQFSFFDNAEVDGDSISLFLNSDLMYKHIRLSDKPFEFTLYKEQINKGDVSITMVAENLGSIPPNTSYMKAMINGKKYEAYLSSTENTSAVIRFRNQE